MFEIEFNKKEIESALPEYIYKKQLGFGAFATVHLVYKKYTGEKFALKKINCFGMGYYYKAGAANYVRILNSLSHKNIIKVYSSLFDNSYDVLYLFLEYADSGDLTTLIQQAKDKKKKIPETTIWKAIADISDGLQYIHKMKIIHRDLKPANIFRVKKNFKIGDMNVSKILQDKEGTTTQTGTPLYTAPEVWDSLYYNNKCDIWSLGIVVYELCTLKTPFEADSIVSLIKKMQTYKPKPLPTIYSSALDDLVKKMLYINPIKRIKAEYVYQIASYKLNIETVNLTYNEADSLMNTIVFPYTHQRWVNLIPSPLPPKTSKKEGGSSINIPERYSNSRERNRDSRYRNRDSRYKNRGDLMENNSSIFRSTERKPIHLPKSKSRSKLEKNSNYIRVPNFPPIYRSNSPVSQRKISEYKHKHERDHSNSSKNNRKSILEYVQYAKYVINND